MIERVVGIDPGLKGALVLLVRGRISEAVAMPTTKGGTRTYLDPLKLRQTLLEMKPDHIVMELPLFLPGAAAQAQGTTGINWGMLYATVQLLGIPHTLVMPADWTRVIHTFCVKTKHSDNAKVKTKECFDRLYPETRWVKDGPIDACLIAFWWCWTQGLLVKYRTNK